MNKHVLILVKENHRRCDGDYNQQNPFRPVFE